ncbi:MAG: DUF4349 domain-containing protein [Spirochaetota bacterium]
MAKFLKWWMAFFLYTLAVFRPAFASGYKVTSYQLYLVHPQPEKAIYQIRKLAAAKQGYTLFLQNSQIKISVPKVAAKSTLQKLRGLAYVNDEVVLSSDVGKTVLSLQTKLSVKKKYLQDLKAIFEESDLNETLEMEKELSRAIQETEQIQGQIQKHQASSQRVLFSVSISRDSQANHLQKRHYSPYRWVNRLGIANIYSK